MTDAVDIAVFFLGYVGACSRFQGGGEPIDAVFERVIRSESPEWFVQGPTIAEIGPVAVADSFMPLFEALNWATSLEQYIRASWPSELSASERWHDSIPFGSTVRAVQFVRNSVHHDWAQALALSEGDRNFPARVACWMWVWRQQLPSRRRDVEGERLYRDELAGEPVIGALGRLLAIFGKAMRVLHSYGVVRSDLVDELLPALDGCDPAEFSRDVVTGNL